MEPRAARLAARLCQALRGEDDAAVAALLREGANPNLVLPEGAAAVHLAAGVERGGGIRRLGLLLRHGGDPNARSGEDLTPVHVAASWGCATCLRLLLMEGGDPLLEDQDGNTAINLALEQENEVCVSILQGEGRSSWFAQRRAESFLSTITEDAGETGPLSRLCDSCPCPSGQHPLSSLKEARQHGEQRRASSRPKGAAPNCLDRSASSFLTECSWQCHTLSDPSDFGIWPAASADPSLPSPKLASSHAEVQACWEGEVGVAGVNQSWDIQSTAEGGGSSPPGPDAVLLRHASLDSEGLLFRGGWTTPHAAESSASLGIQAEPGAGQLLSPQDPGAWDLPQDCGFLDPGLAVRFASQDGTDATLPGPVCLFSRADSTATSDSEKTVVDPASLLGAGRTPEGCSARGGSLSRCSAASPSQYASCISECCISTVEGPGCGCVQKWEGGRAAVCCSSEASDIGQGGLCSGPPARNSGGGTETPVETGLRGERTVPARSEGLQRLDLSAGTQDAGEREPSSFTQDTIPVQWTLEERSRLHGNGSPGPLGTSSNMGDTEVALCPAANVGEEASASLDSKLRSMMLATKAFHSPLLQSNRKCCPGPPRPQSPTIRPLPHESISSSLFDESLEMPQRPRRVRIPRGPGPASDQGPAAVSLRRPPPPAREAEELEEGRSILARPSSWTPALSPGPHPFACSPASSGREVCRGEDLSGRTDLELKKPPPGDGQTSFAAPEIPEVGDPEGLGARGSPGKRAQKPSRVSFSRLSARGLSAACHPGMLSPISQDVPLSPGGRPANLSATEPVEYLYVDEDEGHTLIEQHIPPVEDSVASASSSEDTIIYDWQMYAREAAGGRGNGGSAPLNPGHLSDEALAGKLRDFGVNPGPVTALTRKVYVQLLEKLIRDPKTRAPKGSAAYSPELAFALETYRIPDAKADEMALAAQFDQPDKSRRWREGLLKSSFNYLLLDPRVTQNLPFRCQFLSQAECLRTFVSAIFYVGKGKRSRPYRHLYEALTHYREGQRKWGAQACSKVQHILEIWASGQGVISMHCFQNVIPVEAYTREACMVDTIGLKMLTNQKKGNYYGTVANWPMKRRRRLGIFLLHRALQIFLAEGERQLRPADI
ncbi:ankyrin repeat and LEM domain-containing protein 1 [Liasis olivaceus]